MKVEVDIRWLLVLVSGIIMFLLRHQTIALITYVSLVTAGLVLWAALWPKLTQRAYERLHLGSLKCQSDADVSAFERELSKYRWLQWTRYAYGLDDVRASIAHRKGEHRVAIRLWTSALRSAPNNAVIRLHLNVAKAHVSAGEHHAAEARYRHILAISPGSALALRELEGLLESRSESDLPGSG